MLATTSITLIFIALAVSLITLDASVQLMIASSLVCVFATASFALAAGLSMSISPDVWAFGAATDNEKILLDGACTGHITGNKQLLSNIRTTFPTFVKGATGLTASCTAGTLSMLDETMQVVPGAPTLLSQACMRDGYDVQLVNDATLYVLRHRKRDRTLFFPLHRKVYPLACIIGGDGEVEYQHEGILSKVGGIETMLDVAERYPRTDAYATRAISRARVRARELLVVGKAAKPISGKDARGAAAARLLEKTVLGSRDACKKLTAGGHLVGCDITEKDFDTALDIFGPNSDSLMANPFKADTIPRVAKMGRTVPRGDTNLAAYADILFLWGLAFCVFTVRSLGMTFAHPLENRGEAELSNALITTIDKIRSAGFKVDEVHFDREKAADAKACKGKLADRGVRMIKGTRDDHVVIVERENASIRRRLIQLFLGLTFRVPISWIEDATTYVIDMKNFLHRSDQDMHDDTAAEKFYGRRFHFKEFWLKFGDFVLAKIPTTAVTDKGYHREECVFLRRDWLNDNEAVLYSFKKKKIISREFSELNLLPMPANVIDIVNEIADKEIKDARMDSTTYDFKKVNDDDRRPADERIRDAMLENLMFMYSNRELARQLARDGDETPDADDYHDDDDDDSDDEHPNDPIDDYDGPFADDSSRFKGQRTFIVKDGDRQSNNEDDSNESFVYDIYAASAGILHEARPLPKYQRVKAFNCDVKFDFGEEHPPRETERKLCEEGERRRAEHKFNMLKSFYATSRTKNKGMINAFNISMKDAFSAYPAEAYASAFKEVDNVLKRTFRAVDCRRLTKLQRKQAVPCMLFLKIKLNPHSGDFDKLKSRLVACQHKGKQDPSQINHPSSPTVSSTALLTFLVVATSKDYVLASADVPAAYLFAKTSKNCNTVHAFFDKATTKIALDAKPELQAYVDEKGRLWGALDYSLYGLVESGYMWYQHVATTLTSMGFTASDADPCIWIGTLNGEEIMIALYVDDFAAAARTRAILRGFFKELDKTYPGVYDSMCNEGIITYLGCSIDATEQGVTYVHQPEFTRALVSDFDKGPYGPAKKRSSPAPLDALAIDDESPPLDAAGESYFRSMLMRTAYLINMTRFDLKVPLMALSRRMHCATEQDMSRLKHLIGYISTTESYGLTLKPGNGPLRVFSYTDAAHAVMRDFKSVTGGAIVVGTGGGTVYAKSSKQSIVAKSSTECEYIACSDVASQVIHVRNLLTSFGIPQPPAVIFVDNESAIRIVKNGRAKAMLTRHIGIRRAWISERCEEEPHREQELEIAYCSTGYQVADVLTKPLTGALLQRMTDWLLGWKPHPGPTDAAREKRRASSKKDEEEKIGAENRGGKIGARK